MNVVFHDINDVRSFLQMTKNHVVRVDCFDLHMQRGGKYMARDVYVTEAVTPDFASTCSFVHLYGLLVDDEHPEGNPTEGVSICSESIQRIELYS